MPPKWTHCDFLAELVHDLLVMSKNDYRHCQFCCYKYKLCMTVEEMGKCDWMKKNRSMISRCLEREMLIFAGHAICHLSWHGVSFLVSSPQCDAWNEALMGLLAQILEFLLVCFT
jgi:hypothetical protein